MRLLPLAALRRDREQNQFLQTRGRGRRDTQYAAKIYDDLWSDVNYAFYEL
jgi:hypothetical protein